jgi:hypothetical protein
MPILAAAAPSLQSPAEAPPASSSVNLPIRSPSRSAVRSHTPVTSQPVSRSLTPGTSQPVSRPASAVALRPLSTSISARPASSLSRASNLSFPQALPFANSTSPPTPTNTLAPHPVTSPGAVTATSEFPPVSASPSSGAADAVLLSSFPGSTVLALASSSPASAGPALLPSSSDPVHVVHLSPSFNHYVAAFPTHATVTEDQLTSFSAQFHSDLVSLELLVCVNNPAQNQQPAANGEAPAVSEHSARTHVPVPELRVEVRLTVLTPHILHSATVPPLNFSELQIASVNKAEPPSSASPMLSPEDSKLLEPLCAANAGPVFTLQDLHQYFFDQYLAGSLAAALARWESVMFQWRIKSSVPTTARDIWSLNYKPLVQRKRVALISEIEAMGLLYRSRKRFINDPHYDASDILRRNPILEQVPVVFPALGAFPSNVGTQEGQQQSSLSQREKEMERLRNAIEQRVKQNFNKDPITSPFAISRQDAIFHHNHRVNFATEQHLDHFLEKRGDKVAARQITQWETEEQEDTAEEPLRLNSSTTDLRSPSPSLPYKLVIVKSSAITETEKQQCTNAQLSRLALTHTKELTRRQNISANIEKTSPDNPLSP